MNERHVDDREYQEMRYLHELSARDLEFFKSQQWKVSNYSGLLYASLVFLAKEIHLSAMPLLFFLIVNAIIYNVGVSLIYDLDIRIDDRRERQEISLKFFSSEFRIARKKAHNKSADDNGSEQEDKASLLWYFFVFLSLGYAVVFFFVTSKAGLWPC